MIRRQPRPSRRIHAGAAALVLIATSAGCGGAGPVEAPTPPTRQLIARHFDQVCAPLRGPFTPLPVDAFVDTVGLGEALLATGHLPERVQDAPTTTSLMLLFGRSGQLEEALFWDRALEPEVAREVVGIVGGRAGAPEPLLSRTSVHAELVIDRFPQLRVARPIDCLPHLRHPPEGRPFGLPDTVTLTHGRIRLGESPGDRAVVRLRISELGRVLTIDSVEGRSQILDEVRRIVPELSFEPALRNGLPIPADIHQIFAFRRGVVTGGGR